MLVFMGGFDLSVIIFFVGVIFVVGIVFKVGGIFNLIVECLVFFGVIVDFILCGFLMGGLLKFEIIVLGVNIMIVYLGLGDGFIGVIGILFLGLIMVGVVSLLKEVLFECNVFELKVMLMNIVNFNVIMELLVINFDVEFVLISYIGVGLVDVNKVVNLLVVVWVVDIK